MINVNESAAALARMVPGFDFLQGLVKNAGAALPNVGQWIAPTLDPHELGKRIDELKTVQFWLEQNARALGVTIQALEVQRMTLSTLKTMNVSIGDLGEALKVRLGGHGRGGDGGDSGGGRTQASGDEAAPTLSARFAAATADFPAPAPAPTPAAPEPEPAPEPVPAPAPTPKSRLEAKLAPQAPAADAGGASPGGAVDPMQWWGALTQQFAALAGSAMREAAADATRAMAGTAVRQRLDAAGETFRKAATMPMDIARNAASQLAAASGSAAGAAKTSRAAGPAPGRKTATKRAAIDTAAAKRAGTARAAKKAAPRGAR